MAARAVLAATVRRPFSFSSCSSSTPVSLVHRRGLVGGGDHHGPPKVNFWEDPMSPSKWKEEHFVIISLTGWGLVFYGGYKAFTGGKKEKKDEDASTYHFLIQWWMEVTSSGEENVDRGNSSSNETELQSIAMVVDSSRGTAGRDCSSNRSEIG